ncbi:hypothetical protein BHM03_00045549 [Ensete ventricosum]|nr:hypothetical protein BHM03_00045549 [Ensete ventricosum]
MPHLPPLPPMSHRFASYSSSLLIVDNADVSPASSSIDADVEPRRMSNKRQSGAMPMHADVSPLFSSSSSVDVDVSLLYFLFLLTDDVGIDIDKADYYVVVVDHHHNIHPRCHCPFEPNSDNLPSQVLN